MKWQSTVGVPEAVVLGLEDGGSSGGGGGGGFQGRCKLWRRREQRLLVTISVNPTYFKPPSLILAFL